MMKVSAAEKTSFIEISNIYEQPYPARKQFSITFYEPCFLGVKLLEKVADLYLVGEGGALAE
jgi:hypothetical protein